MTAEVDRERSAILEELASPDEEFRRLAVERLLALPASEAIPRLVDALGDESWRVRKAAVERLVACAESEQVAESLITALADGENPGRRNSAVEALVACGNVVTTRLIASLSSDDVDVRKLIVDAIAGIGDESARESMIETLQDSDSNVRAAAADALAVLGSENAIRALQEALQADPDQLVRFSALRALAQLEAQVTVAELAGALSDPVLRPAAHSLLGYCDGDAEAQATLLKGLALSSRGAREAAMGALLCQLSRCDGEQAMALITCIRDSALACEGLVPMAVERLAESELTTRLMLVQFLGLVASDECVVPILESTRDEAIAEVAHSTLEDLGPMTERVLDAAWPQLDSELRRRACALFARTDGDPGAARLIAALDDSDAELRAEAARSLGARGAVEALPELVRRLEAAAADDDPDSADEREALVDALIATVEVAAQRGASAPLGQTVRLLCDRLQSSIESVRLASARVIARIAEDEQLEVLTNLLRDPSAPVRRVAIEGLCRLDCPRAAEPMRLALADESPLVRTAAALGLGTSRRDDALEDLRRSINDEDSRVCAAAVRAIGMQCSRLRGDAAGFEHALALLALPFAGTDGIVMMAALEALDTVGGPEAAEQAMVACSSPEEEIVQAAVGCIGRHGDEKSLASLVPLVQHAAWGVRGEVIQVLADRRFSRSLPAILRRLEIEQDSFVRDLLLRALRCLEE